MNESRQRLKAIIEKYDIAYSDYEAFLALPFNKVFKSLRTAVQKGDETLPFGLKHKTVFSKIQYISTKAIDPKAAKLVQIMVDRPFQYYLSGRVGRWNASKIKSVIDISGLTKLQAARDEGQAICLVNSHFGCGLLIPLILGKLGFPVTSFGSNDFYKAVGIDMKDKVHVRRMRGVFPAKILAAAIQEFRAGRLVHMASDGYTGQSGRIREFHGRQRKFAEGFGYFGTMKNTLCFPVFCTINEGGQISLEICDPVARSSLGEKPAQIDDMVSQYISLLSDRWAQNTTNIQPNIIARHFKFPAIGSDETSSSGSSRQVNWEKKWSDDTFSPAWLPKDCPVEIRQALETGALTPKHRLLDIGCGNGKMAHDIALRGVEVVGLDFSKAAIGIARRDHSDKSLKLRFRADDMCDPELKLRKFDWLVDRGCLHVIPNKDYNQYFQNAARALKADGRLLIFHKTKSKQSGDGSGLAKLKNIVEASSKAWFQIEDIKVSEFGGQYQASGAAIYLRRNQKKFTKDPA